MKQNFWKENWLNLIIVLLIGLAGYFFSGKLNSLSTEISTVQSKLAENKTTVDDNNKRIKDLEKQAEDIHTDVKAMKAEFDKLTRAGR